MLAQTVDGERVYNEDASVRRAVLHAIGDSNGFIKTGLQSSYWKELTGYSLVNGVFQPSGKGNDIQTTLDANLCAVALKALGSYKARWPSPTTKRASCSAWSAPRPLT